MTVRGLFQPQASRGQDVKLLGEGPLPTSGVFRLLLAHQVYHLDPSQDRPISKSRSCNRHAMRMRDRDQRRGLQLGLKVMGDCMRVVIYGVDAIGGTVAAALSLSG